MKNWKTHLRERRVQLIALGASVMVAVAFAALAVSNLQFVHPGAASAAATPDNSGNTTTPIKHVVVIYDENVSFDHYFATYPYAANTDGTAFHAAPDTPTDINTELNAGLIPGSVLPSVNPNASTPTTSQQYTQPNPNLYQPQRLDDSEGVTCDQDHSYGPEQSAMNGPAGQVGAGGQMANFVQSTNQTCATQGTYSSPGLVMDYYDGNTVTGLWNYAQNYAMSDNNWDTVFGPSTPGALNLISGNTDSGTSVVNADVDPDGDAFGTNASVSTPTMKGANVGDLLNDKNVSWGWFEGGFSSETASMSNVAGQADADYQAHHDPFQYYQSTENWNHTAPASGSEVGFAGPANHQYDISDFNDIFSNTAINGSVPQLPAVSYLKAPSVEDGHAGYSDPLDEQEFLTSTINEIEQSPYWDSTAIVITYDDSDGWYDHVAPTITNSSATASGDTTTCTTPASDGVPALDGYQGRCGPSQRLPLIVISPYAKRNYVSHALTDQVSVLKFIEQNWSTGGIDSISSVPGSFDSSVNSLDDMFDFSHPQDDEVLLNSTMYTAGNTSGENNINPDFGAVTSTPADPVAPTPSPTVSVAQTTISLPQGGTLPSESDFLASVGATISAGTASADLSGVNTSTPGIYDVTVGGSDNGVPVTQPATVQVTIAPIVKLAESTLDVPVGTSYSSSLIRSAVGATITSGTLNTIDLSGVNFNQVGTYTVQVTGSDNGIAAIPATLTIYVQGPTAPPGSGPSGPGPSGPGPSGPGPSGPGPSGSTLPSSTPPVLSLADSTLTYGVGADPTVQQVTDAADLTISAGTVDAISLAGVDFNTPGVYSVKVSGGDGKTSAAPVSLTIEVIEPPAVTLGISRLTTPLGTPLTSAQIVSETQAHISEGTIDPVVVAGVNFKKAGTYTVEVTGSYDGVDATPAKVTITVAAAGYTTKLTSSKRSQTYRASAVAKLTVKVATRAGTAKGKVVIYDGKKKLGTVTLRNGKATFKLPKSFRPGVHSLRAKFSGAGTGGTGTSNVVRFTVHKAPAAHKRHRTHS